MADIKVVIQLQDTIEDEINSLESPTYVSNASINKTGEQFNTLSTRSAGANLKSWATGSLSLADGYVGGANTQLIEQYGYNGYVFGAVPESKQLTVTLEVVGKYIDSIIVYGDRTANQFPTKAYRDGNPNDIIYSDDPVWAIKFNQQSTSHTITFLEWNRANYNACITYVAELKNELTLDKSWVKSVESLSQSTGQPKEIYYGVVPNSGSVTLVDVDGEIKDYVQDGVLPTSNIPLTIFANGKPVSNHMIEDSEYNVNGKTLSLDLNNKLSRWDDVIYLGNIVTDNTTLFDLLQDVLFTLGYNSDDIDSMLDTNIVYGTDNQFGSVKTYLQDIYMPYTKINSASSCRQVVDNICNIGQIGVFQTDTGDIKFISLRPILNRETNIINIPKRCCYSSLDYNIVIKNKYNSVKYDKTYLSISSLNLDTNYSWSVVYNNSVYAFSSMWNSDMSESILKCVKISQNGDYDGFEIDKTYKQDSSIDTSKLFIYDVTTDGEHIYILAKTDSYYFILKGINESGGFDVIKTSGLTVSNTTYGNLVYGNGKFVCFDSNSSSTITNGVRMAYSSDCTTWTENIILTSNIRPAINDLVFGGGKFVGVGVVNRNQISSNVYESVYGYITSSDGISWSYGESNVPQNISYENGKFVGLDSTGYSTGYFYYSSNGTSWSRYSSTMLPSSTANVSTSSKVRYGKGLFVVMYQDTNTYTNYVAYSVNGSTWTRKQIGALYREPIKILEFVNKDVFVALETSKFNPLLTLSKNGSDFYSFKVSVETTMSSKYAMGDNIFNFNSNGLISTYSKYKDKPLGDLIGRNIVRDYSQGIHSSAITVGCHDYAYTSGESAKNWSNGEIIEVGDVVVVEGSDKTWRVTGRNFRKVGVPMIDLELQEVRVVE